jgi:hypothetical protein
MKNPLLLEKPRMMWQWRSWEEFQAASAFTMANYTNIILLVVFVLFAIRQARSKQQEAAKAAYEIRCIKAPEFPPVKEQPEFDWRKTEPLKVRPFKPKYHLTMGEPLLSVVFFWLDLS